MKLITSFVGINNVSAQERLTSGEMKTASNVDLTSTGALVTRRGHTLLRAGTCVHSLYEAAFGLLCVIEADLVLISFDGASRTLIQRALGHTRVWYATLPDGRVAFSNGLINGLTGGGVAVPWGVLVPTEAGNAAAGATPYWLTYSRHSDRLESAPLYGPPTSVDALITGLPQRDGYDINVYFALDGLTGFLAGSTSTDEFRFAGAPSALVNPCVTEHLVPPPPGRCMVRWKSRVLMASGKVVWATSPFQYEQTDARRDFVQMPDDITFIYGGDAGVWVGTTADLFFLRGDTFDGLVQEQVIGKPVLLGSGAATTFALLPKEKQPDIGGAFCIVGGNVCACGDNGVPLVFAAAQYTTAMTEVIATVRIRDGVLQYMASQA